MSQGYAKHRSNTPVSYSDSASVDAFSRLRVASPAYEFDAQLSYNLAPLVFAPITAEAGATVTYDSTNRCALMTLAATPAGGKAYLQSFEYFRYQPGRSQEIFITFNFIETAADVLKFVGYSDGNNGIELQQNGSTVQLKLYSDTTNGDQTVAKADWNVDRFDGTGPSGIVLDLTKTQIMVVDMQALYVGRVRVGFDIGGIIYLAHEFNHANLIAFPYIQTANLPIRAGMTCSNNATTTMRFICCSVISNGGQEELIGAAFSVKGDATAGSGVRTHILSVRPKTTFNSITNRCKFVLDSLQLLVTGNSPVYWELCIGQAISGTTTYNDVNAAYSAFEYNTLGTISGSPALVISSGFVAASAQAKESVAQKIAGRYPITLDADGAVRGNGTLTLLVTGLGGPSACQCAFNWRELR